MGDLVKRLRDLVRMQVGDVPVLIHEAADRIETLTADFAAAEAKLAQAVRVLIERDGGRHDDDCRHLRYIGKPCNCGHVQARAFLATIQPEGETDDKA